MRRGRGRVEKNRKEQRENGEEERFSVRRRKEREDVEETKAGRQRWGKIHGWIDKENVETTPN